MDPAEGGPSRPVGTPPMAGSLAGKGDSARAMRVPIWPPVKLESLLDFYRQGGYYFKVFGLQRVALDGILCVDHGKYFYPSSPGSAPWGSIKER